MTFTTDFGVLWEQIHAFDPVAYAHTRNYEKGGVSYLSPYLSRGIVTLPEIVDAFKNRFDSPKPILKWLQELSWRAYFQSIWAHKHPIQHSIFNINLNPSRVGVPEAILNANTGILAIDRAIVTLYNTGYMHNHLRMYVAMLACNIAQTHWLAPAQWLYYHLLDADWGSNALSWQWVSGDFSRKKYYANQDNINHYTNTHQKGTFLDTDYSALTQLAIPNSLVTLAQPIFEFPAATAVPVFKENASIWINTPYTLKKPEIAVNQQILLIEPALLKQYPLGPKTLQFIQTWAINLGIKQHIVANFEELQAINPTVTFNTLKHPYHQHFSANFHPNAVLYPEITGYYPSFSSWWKKAEKLLFEQW